MLFVARSPLFLMAPTETNVVPEVLHKAAKASQRPWFVLTYMMSEPPNFYWETACAQDLDSLLGHMKHRPNAKIADLLHMSPQGLRDRWSRNRIAFVERGKFEGASVNVYQFAGSASAYCFDHPTVDPDDVHSRKKLLFVDWFRHFN